MILHYFSENDSCFSEFCGLRFIERQVHFGQAKNSDSKGVQMFDRIEFLQEGAESALQLATGKRTTDSCDFNATIVCQSDYRRQSDSGTMLRTRSGAIAIALPYPMPNPTRDAHSYLWERASFLNELAAIQSQDWPGASFWREKQTYSVNSVTCHLKD
jgi:hypothetical protein